MTTLIFDTAKFLRCPACDGTGDVHNYAGEWMGVCACAAGQALGWLPTDTTRNTWPASLSYDTRVDVRMRDGSEFKNCRAYTWSWGEARGTTITHWRLSK